MFIRGEGERGIKDIQGWSLRFYRSFSVHTQADPLPCKGFGGYAKSYAERSF